MKPSKYQQGVLDWLANGEGNATCNAVAGSGKTTTLKLAAKQLQSMGFSPSDVKVIVFGKQNSLDLIKKFGTEWRQSIQTLHSVGFRILQNEVGRFRRDEHIVSYKYRQIAENLKLIPKKTKKRQSKGSLTETKVISRVEHFLTLIDLARLKLSDLSVKSIKDITDYHNLEGIHDFQRVSGAISNILFEGEQLARKDHRIDFTDMVWLPVKWALHEREWFHTYQWVLVDECQDLNAAQLELSLMLAGDKGRKLYVGDPRQAIYGFAGASNRSYQNIVERTNATELPLSICYRCPKSHIDLVNSIYPEIPIQAQDNATSGVLETIDSSNLWDEDHSAHLRVGDMVLSRKTAPLVNLCIRLIGKGIAARVKGKDIGKQIKSELEAISSIEGFNYQDFNIFLEKYKEFKFQSYENLDNKAQLRENLADKLRALSTVYGSQPNATCIQDLCDYIDDLFTDEDSPITLSTCHRAKGLEGERIFIIDADNLPMVWERQKEWQKEQEHNLLYVALTRSTEALYVVGKPDWLKDDDDDEKSVEVDESLLSSSVNSLQVADVTSLHSSETEDLMDVSEVMSLIADVFDYERKVELLTLLTEVVNQEKRDRVVCCLLKDANRSDRAIASECKVSAPFVGKVRKQMIQVGEIQQEVNRVDKRGRKHPSHGLNVE
ncbi:MAG: UvrD-helicase domain-containing protein [Crocosphaera sp.]|nr:UvrD-helicase domain-containing protein [Crocosphaera sp.]